MDNMDSNIDPEINNAAAAVDFSSKYTTDAVVDDLRWKNTSSSAKNDSGLYQVTQEHGEGIEEDDSPVDTATQALKVLAYDSGNAINNNHDTNEIVQQAMKANPIAPITTGSGSGSGSPVSNVSAETAASIAASKAAAAAAASAATAAAASASATTNTINTKASGTTDTKRKKKPSRSNKTSSFINYDTFTPAPHLGASSAARKSSNTNTTTATTTTNNNNNNGGVISNFSNEYIQDMGANDIHRGTASNYHQLPIGTISNPVSLDNNTTLTVKNAKSLKPVVSSNNQNHLVFKNKTVPPNNSLGHTVTSTKFGPSLKSTPTPMPTSTSASASTSTATSTAAAAAFLAHHHHHHHNHYHHQHNKVPAALLTKAPENLINFVIMDPSTKKGLSKRLGRPKRTIRVSDPFMSSENNFNDSIMSRFRFDSLSTSVNSSRTNNRGAAIGAINKEFDKMRNCNDKAKLQHKQRTRGRRVIQHTDGFKLVLEDPGVANDIFVPYNVADNIRDDTKNNNNNVNNNKNVNNKDGEQPTIVLEDYESLRAKGRSTAKDYPQSQSLNIKKYNVNDIKKNSILDAQMDPTLLLADSNKNKATRRRHEIEVERGADVSSSKRRQSIVFVEKNDNRKVGSRSKKS